MMSQNWLNEFTEVLSRRSIFNFFFAIAIFVIGSYIARRSRAAVERLPRLDQQQKILISKFTYYGILASAAAAALSQIGIDVKVLVGAAGVLTVAVGFAAQTSTSNLISGLFLMIERPFGVGDIVAIGDVRGEVMSVDLLSSKIRTFTNLMVRVPNETMVKSNLVNYSYFPVRRLDFNLSIAYESDLRLVEKVLNRAASVHPLCLEDPQPVFIFNGFGESAMNIQFQVWTLSENMTRLQNELYREIKATFDANGIRIPYPTRTVAYASALGAAPLQGPPSTQPSI